MSALSAALPEQGAERRPGRRRKRSEDRQPAQQAHGRMIPAFRRVSRLPLNRRVLAAALFSLVPAFAAAQDETPKRLFWEAEENIGLGLFQSVSLSPLPSLRSGLGPRLPSSLQSGAFEFRINE